MKKSGISIITLIITIIVLIILTGAAVLTLPGENGLINKSKQIALENEKKAIKEQLDISLVYNLSDGTINVKETIESFLTKATEYIVDVTPNLSEITTVANISMHSKHDNSVIYEWKITSSAITFLEDYYFDLTMLENTFGDPSNYYVPAGEDGTRMNFGAFVFDKTQFWNMVGADFSDQYGINGTNYQLMSDNKFLLAKGEDIAYWHRGASGISSNKVFTLVNNDSANQVILIIANAPNAKHSNMPYGEIFNPSTWNDYKNVKFYFEGTKDVPKGRQADYYFDLAMLENTFGNPSQYYYADQTIPETDITMGIFMYDRIRFWNMVGADLSNDYGLDETDPSLSLMKMNQQITITGGNTEEWYGGATISENADSIFALIDTGSQVWIIVVNKPNVEHNMPYGEVLTPETWDDYRNLKFTFTNSSSIPRSQIPCYYFDLTMIENTFGDPSNYYVPAGEDGTRMNFGRFEFDKTQFWNMVGADLSNDYGISLINYKLKNKNQHIYAVGQDMIEWHLYNTNTTRRTFMLIDDSDNDLVMFVIANAPLQVITPPETQEGEGEGLTQEDRMMLAIMAALPTDNPDNTVFNPNTWNNFKNVKFYFEGAEISN